MLKDMIQKDVTMLFNPTEFGELHRINGRELICIVDANTANDSAGQSGSAEFGVNTSHITLFVSEKEYNLVGKLSVNSMLLLDNKHYTIESYAQNMGIYEITLSQNSNN